MQANYSITSDRFVEMQWVVEHPPKPDSDSFNRSTQKEIDSQTNSKLRSDSNSGLSLNNKVCLQRSVIEHQSSSSKGEELQALESKFSAGDYDAGHQLIEKYLKQQSFLEAFHCLYKLRAIVVKWYVGFKRLRPEHQDKEQAAKNYDQLFETAVQIVEEAAKQNGEASYVRALAYFGLPDPESDQEILGKLIISFRNEHSIEFANGCSFLNQAIKQGNKDAARMMKKFAVEAYFFLKAEPYLLKLRQIDDLPNSELTILSDKKMLKLGTYLHWLHLAANEGDVQAARELKFIELKSNCSIL